MSIKFLKKGMGINLIYQKYISTIKSEYKEKITCDI